jgi:hypothetical protein
MSHILDQHVKYEYDEQNFIITFIIQLPTEGQFGLDIYARDPDYQCEKRTMSHCCKYIINYSKISNSVSINQETNQLSQHASHDYSFDKQKLNGTTPSIITTVNNAERHHSPRKYLDWMRQSKHVHFFLLQGSTTSHDSNGSIILSPISLPNIGGNTTLLSQFGMSPMSHPEPSLTVQSTNHVELQFQIRKMVDFTFDLIYHCTSADLLSRTLTKNLNQRLNVSDYVTIKPDGGFNIIFALKLPQQGLYTFTIYAATTCESNESQMTSMGHTDLPPVFTYLIRYV